MFSTKGKYFIKNHLIRYKTDGKRKCIKLLNFNTENNMYHIYVKKGGFVSMERLEACLKFGKKVFKQDGKLNMLVFPDRFVTRKPREIRMGKGKGSPTMQGVFVRPHDIIFTLISSNKVKLNQYLPVLLSKLALGSYVRSIKWV